MWWGDYSVLHSWDGFGVSGVWGMNGCTSDFGTFCVSVGVQLAGMKWLGGAKNMANKLLMLV